MKFNLKVTLKAIFDQAGQFFLDRSNQAGRERFERAKRQLITNVSNHPVSKELDAGIGASNSSGTLSNGRGNLYSFLGFVAGTSPVDDLIQFLEKNINYVPAGKLTLSGFFGRGKATVSIPTQDQFRVLDLPWEIGRSWPFSIEQGISNLSHYLFIRHEASRSGGAIQSKHVVSAANFKPTPYITPILEQFVNDLR